MRGASGVLHLAPGEPRKWGSKLMSNPSTRYTPGSPMAREGEGAKHCLCFIFLQLLPGGSVNWSTLTTTTTSDPVAPLRPDPDICRKVDRRCKTPRPDGVRIRGEVQWSVVAGVAAGTARIDRPFRYGSVPGRAVPASPGRSRALQSSVEIVTDIITSQHRLRPRHG